MKNPQLFLLSKKIHRWLVLLILLLTICMVATGLMMYFGNFLSFSPTTIRVFHNRISMGFSIVLGTMALTGLCMFIFPYVKNKQPEQK
jgi:hypothetical protein